MGSCLSAVELLNAGAFHRRTMREISHTLNKSRYNHRTMEIKLCKRKRYKTRKMIKIRIIEGNSTKKQPSENCSKRLSRIRRQNKKITESRCRERKKVEKEEKRRRWRDRERTREKSMWDLRTFNRCPLFPVILEARPTCCDRELQPEKQTKLDFIHQRVSLCSTSSFFFFFFFLLLPSKFNLFLFLLSSAFRFCDKSKPWRAYGIKHFSPLIRFNRRQIPSRFL